MPAIRAIPAHLPLDWVILGLVMALTALDTMRNGTRRAASFALAAPLAMFLSDAALHAAGIGEKIASLHVQYAQTGLFVGLFFLLFISIYRMMPAGPQSGAFPLQAVFAGCAVAIVLGVTWFQIADLNAYVVTSPLVSSLFGASYRFYWFLLAFVTLALARS